MPHPIIDTPGWEKVQDWFAAQGWTPFPFQEECWGEWLEGKDGLLNAPTGSGKTMALFLPLLIAQLNQEKPNTRRGMRLLWITPMRALAADLQKAMQRAADELETGWQVRVRSGDTSSSEKQKFIKQPPEVLITTPESLHVMMAQKGYADYFNQLKGVVCDEWHELLGTKRGVQVELALARLRHLKPNIRIWGISATIGNLEQALDVLLGEGSARPSTIVKAQVIKLMRMETIFPDEIEHFPWSGHLGLHMAHTILPVIEKSRSTLIFINTRSTTEIWYRHILELAPHLAGQMALHHGSLDRDLRKWVEDALHGDMLKVVICTSTLDLGVDFAPVETVIQVGSPKSVARYLQRAGRSGHQPGRESVIYFLPTNALELIEIAALREAIKQGYIESREPLDKPFDVLVQWLVTLAVSDGFRKDALYEEIKSTYTYRDLEQEEWNWLLEFITTGGQSLRQYDDFHKVQVIEGEYKVTSRRIAAFHRMQIGTIVSEPMMKVAFSSGSSLGSIEEGFISRLKPGDKFWFAGRPLELVRIKEMTAFVKKSPVTTNLIPSWLGARMTLSGPLAYMVRAKLDSWRHNKVTDKELEELAPLLNIQQRRSAVPALNELLIEQVETNEGHHLFIFPFEGRHVHEGLSALLAYRISQSHPITFSIAMNDYGFELLSDEKVDIDYFIEKNLFTTENLIGDVMHSINSTEMAKRRFREVAQISGLLFAGYPGKSKRSSHLQASSSLLFEVFKEHDPKHLILQQAYKEVLTYQLDADRLQAALERISRNKIVIKHPYKPTPFAFPILVDRLREQVTSEKLADRIKKMQLQFDES